MRFDDEHLAELLRVLPPAPEHVVAGAKALFEHLGEAPDEPVDEGDAEDGVAGPSDEQPLPLDEHDDLGSPEAAPDEPDGGDWS